MQIEAAFRFMKEHPRPSNLRDVYEFGVYKGTSLKKICDYLKDNECTVASPFVFGFDSFQGLPSESEGMEVFEKFTEGAYHFNFDVDPIDYIEAKVDYEFLYIIKSTFDNLTPACSIMFPALLVHVDCDIYKSTLDALEFMFENKLIQVGTLVAYDEFRTTISLSGEEAAHIEMFKKYNAGANEIWHYIYTDKQTGTPIRQSLFEVSQISYDK